MAKKAEILQTATVLFGTQGYKDTSMVEVAEQAGVASATVFYHYKTKEELLLTILKEIKTGIQEEFSEYYRNTAFDTGLDKLVGTTSFYLYLASCKEEWFLLLHRGYLYKLAMVSDECRHYLEDIYNCFVDQFEDALRTGVADGSIRTLAPRKIALLLLSMLEGMMRFKHCNIYDPGTMYNDVIAVVHSMAAT